MACQRLSYHTNSIIENCHNETNTTMKIHEHNETDTPYQKLYLCVHRFVQVPVSMVFSCYRGAPKVWKLYPVIKERELRNCKFISTIIDFKSQF